MYYLRTKAAAAAIQFTVDKSKVAVKKDESSKTEQDAGVAAIEQNMAAMVCSLQNKDDCLMCGS